MMKVGILCSWWWWSWWVYSGVGAGLVRAATPCLPEVKVERISPNRDRPFVKVPWRYFRLTAKVIPTEDCPNPPSNLKFCWHVSYNRGKHPGIKSWDKIAQCWALKGASLYVGAYSYPPSNFTVQMVALYPGTEKPRREVLGFFILPFTKKVSLYFQGGEKAVFPHKTDLSFNLAGGRDPDLKPSGFKNVMKLNVKWECSTDDEKAKSWCDGDLTGVSEEIFKARTIHETGMSLDDELYAKATVNVSYVRPGYVYRITAKATEPKWPSRTAEATTERQIVDSGPAPILWIKCYKPCNFQRMLPTEKLRLEAKCGAFPPCIAGVSIYYQWIVTQAGVGPVDLVKFSEQKKSSGVGFDKLTIIPGAFQPGGYVTVEVRGQYYPKAPEEVKAYQKAYDEYKKFQKEKA